MTGSTPPDIPHLWRLEPRAEVRRSRNAAPRRRRFVLLLAVLALAGTIVVVLTQLRPTPRPYYLPLYVTQDLPGEVSWVPLARNDLRALSLSNLFSRILGQPGAPQQRARMAAALAGLKQLQRADEVVVDIAAQMRTGENGEVYLLPADAERDDSRSWISMGDVLGWLAECPAGRKLLILETTTRPWADPIRGVLADDASARIAAMLKDLSDKNRLLILSASAPGQVAHVDEEQGRSLFSFYLEEGLRGWADNDASVGNQDGLVTARELAAFVAARVDRWAGLNQASRQTPVLFGPNDLDFPLVALTHNRPRPQLGIAAARTYPRWLHDAWKLRDDRQSNGSNHRAPRAFRKLEATLLDTESAWRYGVDPAGLRARWTERLSELDEAFAQARDLPTPQQPRALGLAELLGRSPDEAVAKLAAAVARRQQEQTVGLDPVEAEKIEAKLAAEFLDATKGKADFDVASAAFGAAADDTRPRPAAIRFCDRILRVTQPEPLYVETLLLRQLAERADSLRSNPAAPGSVWPIETVRQALDVVRRGERAQGRPRSLAWVRPLLDRAAQTRHDGELLLWQRGYVPPDRAGVLLTQADAELEVLQRDQEAVEDAQKFRDEALFLLPDIVTALDRNPAFARVWEQVCSHVHEVDLALASLAENAAKLSSSSSAPGISFQQQVERLQRATEFLRAGLIELRHPFESDRFDQLIRQARESDAGPSVVIAIDAILSTPLGDAGSRAALWAGRSTVARRLLKKTHQLDLRGSSPAVAPDAGEADSEGWEARAVGEAANHTLWSTALLSLAGLTLDEVHAIEGQRRRLVESKAPLAGWLPLARRIRRAWTSSLPEQYPTDDVAGLDRLSRVLPSDVAVVALDRRRANPTAELRRQEAIALWTWLADRYAYESRELDAAPFFATAASEYQALARPVGMLKASISARPEPVEVSAQHPSATATLSIQLQHTAGTPAELELRILKPDNDWLEVLPMLAGLTRLGTVDAGDATVATYSLARPPTGPLTLPLRVERKPRADDSDTTPPRGFLVQVAIAGRSFAYRVPVALRAAGEQPQILLSKEDHPDGPTAMIDELRLRPARQRQSFYLYVRNPGKTLRTVLVELESGGTRAGGEAPKLALGPGRTQKVVFAGPVPKPSETLDALGGPIHVRLRDAENPGAVIGERSFPLSIAAPAEYVKVTEVRFEPPAPSNDGKNRLTVGLQAVGTEFGPPCPVELVLPPERIPGFIGVKGGTFHGVLTNEPQKTLVLFAEDIELGAGDDEQGEFFLRVDGMPRAMIFRTTLARHGEATTPRREIRPHLAVHAAATVGGAKCNVALEVDNAPADTHLELNLGRYEGGVFQADVALPPFPTAKRESVGFSPTGPGGAWLLEAAIDDWTVALDTVGIQGRRELQAKLLDSDGLVVSSASLPVILDVETPRLVRFLDPPGQARRGGTVTLKAIGAATASGIKQVVFFVGKPADGKAPPKAEHADARQVSVGSSTWTADLHLPEDKKGPTDVSVQFINGAGLSTFESTTIELLDADPSPLGSIAGQVLQGELPQKDLDVLLGNAKGVVIGRTKTGPDGAFSFKGLPKGTYQLYTSKVATGTVGRSIVNVVAGETQQVELKLYR